MNIGYKLLGKLRDALKTLEAEDFREVYDLLDKLEDWMDRHNIMFDHSVFRDPNRVNEWNEYYDSVMKE